MDAMNADDKSGPNEPRRYRIRVKGRLEKSVTSDLGDLEQHEDDDGSTLTGTLIDMSQVFGIIDHLRRLGIEVRSFETEDATDMTGPS